MAGSNAELQFGKAQPLFPASPAGNFDLKAILERIDSDAELFMCRT